MKPSRGFYDVFIRTCAKYPTRIGVRQYESNNYRYFTYSELYGICEYIAQNLQQLRCLKGGAIGLVTDRNFIVPCVIAATHKCNTTFMFLDAHQDIDYLTRDINFKVIITITSEDKHEKSNQEDKHEKSHLKTPDKVISLFGYSIKFFSYISPFSSESYKSLRGNSFVMTTSGSTGDPKHVEVPLSCIQPNIKDLTKIFKVTTNDVIYFSTPLTFDPAMVEIQLAISNGASLLIAPENPDILFSDNKKNSITIWQTTPSKFFQQVEENIRNKVLSSHTTLRILALGGEPLKGVKRLSQLKHPYNKTQIFAMYGVTEMSCWACVAELDLSKIRDDRDIPLGQCLSETDIVLGNENHAYYGNIILVSNTRKCEILNKSRDFDNTSLSRVPNNSVDTGDIGEKKSNNIYFRGRRDDIIKRFGHKINLQYIETTIMMCPKVHCCSCLWLPTPKLVVVYFTSDTLSSRELSDFLRCKMDEKHWPDKVIRVDSLPTNSHGKISKVMLSKKYLNYPTPAQTMQSLKLSFLEELKAILEGDFTYDDIKDKDFFALGGTSFVAVTLCNRLSKVHDKFGKFILPFLITPKNSIKEIMNKAEMALITDLKKPKVKKAKRPYLPKVSAGNIKKKSKVSVNTMPPKEPIEFQVRWSYNTEKCVDGSPTLLESAQNVYMVVGSHSGKIVVYAAVYKILVGVVKVNSRIEASVLCYHEMPMKIPCGVVGAYDGTVVCIKLDSAKQKWLVNIGAMVKSGAVQCFNLIYVAAYDGAIHYLDMKTGKPKGKICVNEKPISADLVLAKGQYIIVATLSGMCAAIHAETKSIIWQSVLSSPVFAKPVLYDDGKFVVFAEVCGEIHCRTVEKGIKIWKFQGTQGNLFSSMYLKELSHSEWQLVFGCHDRKVYSIIIKDSQASLDWRTQVSTAVYSTPCRLTDKYILAVAKIGTMYIIDVSSGLIVSEYQLPNETFSSPCVYGDNIFIGCRNDFIYNLKFTCNV